MAQKVNPAGLPPSYAEATGYSDQSQYQTQYSTTVQTQPASLSFNSGANGSTVPAAANYSNPIPPHTQISSYGNTVEITATVRPLPVGFQHIPVQTKCPTCQVTVMTETKRECGPFFWHMCCILTTACCCCLMLCCPVFKDVVHYCPRCKREVGRWCPNRGSSNVQPQTIHYQNY